MIFLHRLHSLRPFSRHYSHSLNPFLDLLTTDENGVIRVDSPHAAKLRPVLEAYNDAQQKGTLLSVDFQTINEYLWLLRAVTQSMAGLGRRGMFYLAAAVSDFFLPDDRIVSARVCMAHTTGRAQDSEQPRDALSRDGSSPKGFASLGARMEPRRIHCQLQGTPSPTSNHLPH